MTFKQNWEKAATQHQLPEGAVERMVHLALPNQKLISHAMVTGGCANLNIKIYLEGGDDLDSAKFSLMILRIYLRDKDAAYREQKIGSIQRQTTMELRVPAPLTHYIGDLDGYRFAITEFMPGITLRDLLLGDLPHDIAAIMYEVGMMLANITTVHTFPRAGFFDKDLNVITSDALVNESSGGLSNFC